MKEYTLKSVREFNELIENGEAKTMTLAAAKDLKGKRIAWTYFGYSGNEQSIYEMTVGDIVSEWDYYKHQPMEGYESRTAYWESYMSEEKINSTKNTMIVLDENGKDSNFIYCYTDSCEFDEPTCTCSDADRAVYYIILN